MLKRVEKAYRSLDKMKDRVSGKRQELEVERRILFETQKQLDRAKRRNVILFIVCLIILVAYRILLSYEVNTLHPHFGPKKTVEEYGNPIVNGTGIIYWGESSHSDEDIYSQEELEMMVEERLKNEKNK
ncbi:MAG: hypothetical protein IK020_02210 [Clostridiales bacterium]|nr:hypothetical protein [Clostridiales bacterium]